MTQQSELKAFGLKTLLSGNTCTRISVAWQVCFETKQCSFLQCLLRLRPQSNEPRSWTAELDVTVRGETSPELLSSVSGRLVNGLDA